MPDYDDPLLPLPSIGRGQLFRNWIDFVDRVARPLVEADGDEQTEQAAMALYRQVSPYYICVALVMAANRALTHPSQMSDHDDNAKPWRLVDAELLLAELLDAYIDACHQGSGNVPLSTPTWHNFLSTYEDADELIPRVQAFLTDPPAPQGGTPE